MCKTLERSILITNSTAYNADGTLHANQSTDRNPFRYRGEYYDNETGSIYLRARVYAPGLGRFTTEDPIRDGLNWYVYCGGNPVMFRDPTGLFDIRYDDDGNPYAYDGDGNSHDTSWIQLQFPIESHPDWAIQINFVNGKVVIDVFAYIWGNAADDKHPDSTRTYRALAIEGIKYWQGNYHNDGVNYSVIVNVYEKDKHDIKRSSSANYLDIEVRAGGWLTNSYIHYGEEGSSAWNTMNNCPVVLYTYEPNGNLYSHMEFSLLAAHEFGHMAGVGDAYDPKGTNDISHVPLSDIMRFAAGSPNGLGLTVGYFPSNYSMQKLLKAFYSNTYQEYGVK